MINMFFGKQTCLKQYIQDRIIKDYDLPEVTDITNTDYIVIFDENDSRKISLSNIINNTIDKNKPAVVTVIKSDGSKLTMLEAIEAIPDNRKKLGLIVTYNDVNAGWSLIQYTADNLTTFSNINNWKTISTDIATETINNSIKELDDKLVSYYQEHHSDILSLEDKNEHLKQNFNVHVSNTNTQFSDINSHLSNINSQLKEAQNGIDSYIAFKEAALGKLNSLDEETNTINTAIVGLLESTQGLSEDLTKLRTQFNSVARRTDDLDNIVDDLHNSVNTLDNSVSELQRDLTNTSHKCDDIMNLLPTYYSKITALETWKTSTDERLNDMAETLANLDTRLTRLEGLNRVETE